MNVDHIGYAVRDISKAKKNFELLGFSFETIIDDVERNVRILFGYNQAYRIELISPLEKKRVSPVDKYLSNTLGTPYHICYHSDDFDNDIENLVKQGFKVIIEPSPAVAFGEKRVVFMMSLGFGLMEIVEE